MPKKSMSHPLYLTADEKKLFAKLPEDLREGWEVKDEKGKYKDTEKKRMLRLTFMKLTSPELRKFQNAAQKASSIEKLMQLIQSVDLLKSSEDDLIELFFALGPVGMGFIVSTLLTEAKTDQDIDGVALISGIRHSFHNSFKSVS